MGLCLFLNTRHNSTSAFVSTLPPLRLTLAAMAMLQLQFGDTSVSTKDLTQSVGWDKVDAFYQHDAQELSRVLCEKLEEKLKVRKLLLCGSDSGMRPQRSPRGRGGAVKRWFFCSVAILESVLGLCPTQSLDAQQMKLLFSRQGGFGL